MKLGEGDKVVTLSTTEHDEDEITGTVEDDGSADEGANDAAEELKEDVVTEEASEVKEEE